MLLQLDDSDPAPSQPPAPAAGEPITLGEAQELFRSKRELIFAAMCVDAGIERKALAEIPVNELERLYLKHQGGSSVDRVQLRMRVVEYANGAQ